MSRGGFISRRPKPESEKKVRITIALKSETVKKLREIKGYNGLLQKLIDEYFSRRG